MERTWRQKSFLQHPGPFCEWRLGQAFEAEAGVDDLKSAHTPVTKFMPLNFAGLDKLRIPRSEAAIFSATSSRRRYIEHAI